MLSTKDVAKELGVTERRVLALIAGGRLKASRFGRAWVMSRRAVDAVRERPTGRPKKSGK